MIVAFEGIDGSGKGTQAALLRDRARREGLKVEMIAFPMYDASFFGGEIGRYLNGEFGDLWTVHPKLAATLYAGDRFESRERIATLRAGTDLLVCDRYTPSNQAHQSVKLPEPERAGFVAWVERLEHEVFHIPRPDRVVFLDMPPATAAGLVLRKSARSYTDRSADIHEVDVDYLTAVHAAYGALAARPEWLRISCVDRDGVLRPEADIHRDVWSTLRRAGALP